MELKVNLNSGFENYDFQKKSNCNFMSTHVTLGELYSSNVIKNSSEAIALFTRLSHIRDIGYPLCQTVICCYRQDFHSVSALSNIVSCKLDILNSNGSISSFVDAFNKTEFIPERMMNEYIFYNNVKSDACGYICMDLFFDTIDVYFKVKSVEQDASNNGIELLINEVNADKIAASFKEMYRFIKMAKKVAEASDHDIDLAYIIALSIEQKEEFVDIKMILDKENTTWEINNTFYKEGVEKDSISLDNLIILDENRFYELYGEDVSENKLMLENVDCRSLFREDKVTMELLTLCVDICYAKEHIPFIVFNVNREYARVATDEERRYIDKQMSLLLPLFSEFVRRVTNGGTVLYVGVEDGSLTEAALKTYERTLGIV